MGRKLSLADESDIEKKRKKKKTYESKTKIDGTHKWTQ